MAKKTVADTVGEMSSTNICSEKQLNITHRTLAVEWTLKQAASVS